MATLKSYGNANSSYGPFVNAGAPSAGTDEVQSIQIAAAEGGTFKLKLGPFRTGAISWSATDNTLIANIDAALEALPNVGTGGITTAAGGTLSSGLGTVDVTFTGANGKKNIPLMTAYNSLTGTNPTVTVAVKTAGVDATARGAPKGALLVDSTNGLLYQNGGTATAPTWGKVGVQS